MAKYTGIFFGIIIIIFISVGITSCDNSSKVPFPEELGFSQPVSVPVQFTSAKKLIWDTAKHGGVTPVTKKLDFEALPATPYDTTTFTSFTQPPAISHFDWNSLPSNGFNLENLPSKSLQFKSSVLTPTATKALIPALQKGKRLSIFDFGQMQGLQAKFITSICKDRNGLLWIGSMEGLYRYDGNEIKTFVSVAPGAPIIDIIEDNNGMIWFLRSGMIGMIDLHKGIVKYSTEIGNVVNSIARMTKDEKGRIWVCNNMDKAISIIDPEAGTYRSIDNKTGYSNAGAYGAIEDNNKRMWITTASDGVIIIDMQAGKIKHLQKVNGLSNDTLSAITKDKTGQIWIASISGVDAVDPKTGMIKQYSMEQGFKKKYRFDLKFDKTGVLWVGANGEIQLLDPAKERTKYVVTNDGITGNVVTALAADNYNRMWLASTQGINIIAQNGETVHPLGATVIVTMMEDDDENLWVGTDKGIQIINVQKNIVRLLNKSKGLGHDFIQSFFKVNGKMFVTTNGGLDVIDPAHKTISHTGKKEGLISDTVYAAFKDKAGNMWVTGPSNGIDMIDSAKKIISHTDLSKGLSDNNIQDIKQDRDGMIWLATNSGGINIFDPIAGTVKYLNNEPGLKDTCSKMLLEDNDGRMWIGTDKGIYVVDTKKGTLTTITTKQGLPSNRVLSLLQYKGSVIAGTNTKTCIITAPAPVNTTSGTKTFSQWQLAVLANSEGLMREQTSAWSTDCITRRGQYFWGDRGLTVINDIEPRSDSVSTYVTGINVMTQPQFFLDDRKLKAKDTLWAADTFYVKGDQSIKAGYTTAKGSGWDSVTGPYNMPVNLHLPHNHNYIQFQFGQAHLGRQDTTWYCYMLEGIDKKWSSLTSNTFTENYLNLPPGNYTFKVSGRGISGKWSKPTNFSFTIAAPWYKTWLAFTLFALAGISILRAYIVFRSRRFERENKLLEEKITLRTNQLQQSIEDLKATQMQLVQSEKMASLGELTAGIAHEIQNPLNFVNNFSEVNTELVDEMLQEIDNGDLEEVKALANDIKENEQRINQHGKRADAIVKGMLQHSRANAGKKEPTDINALADEYLRLSYHGLRAKDKSFNADFTTNFDTAIERIDIVQQDIGRVLLNLFNNAFYSVHEKKKQLNENYKPAVAVSTKRFGDKIEIAVKDNGNGIPQKVVDKIFQPFFTTKPTGQGTGLGLSLSYDIIKAHGGELKVQTTEGEGAQFIINLPVT